MNVHQIFESPAGLPPVRRAHPGDLEELLEMGRALHRENGLLHLDEEKIRKKGEDGVSGRNGVVGIVPGAGCIEAMIHLEISQYWYAKDHHLEELYNYVRPEFRRSQNAKALIEFAKRSAIALGLPLLIGIVSNSRTEHKIRLYERSFGKPSGAFFLWNARTGASE